MPSENNTGLLIPVILLGQLDVDQSLVGLDSNSIRFLKGCNCVPLHFGTGLGSVIIGAIYALVDGFVGGAIFGWFYNLLACE